MLTDPHGRPFCLCQLEAPVPTLAMLLLCHWDRLDQGPLLSARPAPLWTCKHGNLGHPTRCLTHHSDTIPGAPLAPCSPGRSGFQGCASQPALARGAEVILAPSLLKCLPWFGGGGHVVYRSLWPSSLFKHCKPQLAQPPILDGLDTAPRCTV